MQLASPFSFLSLDALDPNAYAAYQASSNLKAVVEKWKQNKAGGSGIPGLKKNLSIKATLMTPVKPMLVSLVYSAPCNCYCIVTDSLGQNFRSAETICSYLL